MDRQRFPAEALSDSVREIESLVHRGEQCEIVNPHGEVLLLAGQPSGVISPFDLGHVESHLREGDERAEGGETDSTSHTIDEWLDL